MITKNKLFIGLGVIILCLFVLLPNYVWACTNDSECTPPSVCLHVGASEGSCVSLDEAQGPINNTGASTDITAGNPGQSTPLSDPLKLDPSHPLGDLANRVIKTALGISGVLALLAFIYAGIIWMIPFGDQTGNIKKGKQMMIWAVLGLVVIFGSYAILTFITGALGIPK